MLESCFRKNRRWTKDIVDYIAKNTQLTHDQIYKWNWDQNKKAEKNPMGTHIPSIDEFGGYCKFEQTAQEPIAQILDIDYNAKVAQLLNFDSPQSEKLDSELSDVDSVSYKRMKISDTLEKRVPPSSDTPLPTLEKVKTSDEEPKKLQNSRKESNMTDATDQQCEVPGLNKLSEGLIEDKPNQFFFDELYGKDYNFGRDLYNFDEPDFNSFNFYSDKVGSV